MACPALCRPLAGGALSARRAALAAAGAGLRRADPAGGGPAPSDPSHRAGRRSRPARPHRPAQYRPAEQMGPRLCRSEFRAPRRPDRAAGRRAAPDPLAGGGDPRLSLQSRFDTAGGARPARRLARARATCCCSAASSRSSTTLGAAIAAYNSLYRADPRGAPHRPLRQVASRPLWRISADAAAPLRASACRGSRPAISISTTGRGRARSICPASAMPACRSATRSSSPARSSTAPTGPISSSIPPTTPGSAPGARPSISPRRGCARSRKGCRSSAPRRPASRR